jgi:ATP-dependent RNA helicase RhlE
VFLPLNSYRYRQSRRHARPAPLWQQTSPTRPCVPRSAPAASPPPDRAALERSPFAALGLVPPLVRAVVEEGYTQPTPVQVQVVPRALEGRDVLACAQTGTGKTAAFVLPVLQRLATEPRTGEIRALVLTPTRELATQITERVAAYGRHITEHVAAYGRHLRLRHAVVYGGVSQRGQEAALRASPDVLVATPGRLLDLVRQGVVGLGGVTHFVLDEADRMLDMGFLHDVRRVVASLPHARRTLLFSATMPRAIEALARTLLVDPVRIAIEPAVRTAVTVKQSVMFVGKTEKRTALERVLRDGDEGVERAIVFTRTKHGASRLSEQLARSGIGAEAIHGNKSQSARERALDAFRRGAARVLVATDVAARGIDIDGISHVINFDLPNVAENYVHRIGRTGRAGATGRAISFCDRDERGLLTQIERLIGQRLTEWRTADSRAEPGAPNAAVPPAEAWALKGRSMNGL